MNNKRRAQSHCKETLKHKPNSLYGLLSQAEAQIDADEFEPALQTLDTAKDHHGQTREIQNLQQKAQTLLRRSKQKDYYKVLGVDRDADDKTIKRAHRSMTRQYHPDKAATRGFTKEEAQKKMEAINEAYEVLSNPELRARFDNGDDPNDQESAGNPFQGSPFGFGGAGGGGGQQFFFQQGGGGGSHFKFSQGGFNFPGGFPFG